MNNPNTLSRLNALSLSQVSEKENLLHAIEELGELSVLLIKTVNKGILSTFDLVDEVSDNYVMLSRLIAMYDIGVQVNARVDYKTERQIERLTQ